MNFTTLISKPAEDILRFIKDLSDEIIMSKDNNFSS